MQKGVANLVLIIGVILIGLMVYGTFHIEDIRKFELKFPKSTPVKTANPSTSAKPSPTPDETAGWHKYQSSHLNVSFRYPADASVEENPFVESYMVHVQLKDLSISVSPKGLDTDSVCVFGQYPELKKVTLPLRINDKDVTAELTIINNKKVITCRRLTVDGYDFVIQLTSNDDQLKSLVSKIISTFKIINTSVSPDEKARIDIWISKNSLNQFGEPNDQVYTGGTPLFDETTGQSVDRYDYIIRHHPERPWNN